MAEYIEREALKSKKVYSEERHEYVVPVAEIDWQPTADVIPRAEVAREIFEEIERKVKSLLTLHLEEINKEYIRDTPLYDRHSGIIFALQGMDDFIAELKKKYTEGE